MRIQVELEDWPGSPVIHQRGPGYGQKPADSFNDAPASLKPRQAVFYRNLIRLAEVLGSSVIPVQFELQDETALYLDRGCIKIAEHAGFIEPLENSPAGFVESIRLAWRAQLNDERQHSSALRDRR